MTDLLQKAIEALQTIEALSEEAQNTVAADVLRRVQAAKTNGTSTLAWGPRWRDLSPTQRAAEFKQWAERHQGGPGLPVEATHRDTIYD